MTIVPPAQTQQRNELRELSHATQLKLGKSKSTN